MSFPVFNVRDFGAVGNGREKDSAAIQKAIDSAYKAGGGTVYVPPGGYLAGAIHMKSNVALFLEAGAIIYASECAEDYPEKRTGLITGEDLHNISILGRGKINGQGYAVFKAAHEVPSFRPLLIRLIGCRDVTIDGIILEYASSWTIHLLKCDSVNVSRVKIYNNVDRWNTDGIDIDCCKNVHISDCHIIAGDDCIVLKSTQPYNCENITVTNCTLETTCSALKLGTESLGEFRNCVFSNCVIRNTKTPISLYMKDGGTMENIIFSNMTIETESHKSRVPSRGPGEYPILINIEKRFPDSKLGRIRNIIIRDMIIESAGRCFIEGHVDQPIRNMIIENAILRVRRREDTSEVIRKPRGGRGSPETLVTTYDRIPAYFVMANVKGLILRNIQIHLESEDLEKRFALFGDNLQDVDIDGFSVIAQEGELPAMKFSRCSNVKIQRCQLQNIFEER